MKKIAILLGECPNPRVCPVDSWEESVPFAAERNSSGLWLQGVLRWHQLRGSGWSFILENAVTIHRVAPRLGESQVVIALSKRVAEMLHLPYLPHPAYWKRFRHGQAATWLAMLDKILEDS